MEMIVIIVLIFIIIIIIVSTNLPGYYPLLACFVLSCHVSLCLVLS